MQVEIEHDGRARERLSIIRPVPENGNGPVDLSFRGVLTSRESPATRRRRQAAKRRSTLCQEPRSVAGSRARFPGKDPQTAQKTVAREFAVCENDLRAPRVDLGRMAVTVSDQKRGSSWLERLTPR
jgi:hypothetical protein